MTERKTITVTAALKRAGLKAGGIYYSQMGYRDRVGNKVTEPTYFLTRTRKARYGGIEDLGYVVIFAISDPTTGVGTAADEKAMLDAAQAAIEKAGLPFTRHSTEIRVLD